MIDVISAVAVFSVSHRVITSLDFSISYYSTAKIQVSVLLSSCSNLVNFVSSFELLTEIGKNI